MKQRCLAEFARYTIPNVLGMLGLSCYILADTFFISQGLGAQGLAALNLAIPVYSAVHGVGLMLGMGGATRYAIDRGQGGQRRANAAFTQTVCCTAVAALLFVLAGLFLSGHIAALVGAHGDVFAMTHTYLRVILLFAPAFLTNEVLLCFVRNDGAPRLAMLAMLGGSFSNILLDYVLIFPLRMGMLGAVLATGIAPLVSLLILSRHWGRHAFHFARAGWRARELLTMLSLGVPSLVAEVSSGLVIMLFNAILLRLRGNVGVAAYGVVANLSLVVMAVFTGVAQGVQPLLSHAYGVGERWKVRRLLRYALGSVLLLSAAIVLGVFACAENIAAAFNSGGDAQLQRLAVEGLRIYFTASAFAGCNIILCAYFTSTANALPAQAISLLRGLAVIMPVTLLLSALWGVTGVWLAFPVTECLVAAVGAVLFVVWKKREAADL